MNKNKWKQWLFLLFAAILIITGIAGAAAEEESLQEAQVRLFSEGKLPAPSRSHSKAFNAEIISLLETQLENMADTIDISAYRITIDDFKISYQEFLNSHPELFHVKGGYSYYYSGNYITRLLPKYKYTAEELPAKQAIYNSGLSAILSHANQGGNAIAKMLRANDYICANYQYDLSYSIYSPEEMFEQKTGVCQAYMLVYRAVLNAMGITNATVTSDAMNHTWNMVQLNGSWYHIDVTWNDPISDVPLRAMHNNFLLSDAGLINADHYDWVAPYTAANSKYDQYFWVSLRHPLAVIGNLVYYVDDSFADTSRTVFAFNLSTESASSVYSFDYGYGSYYRAYTPVWVAGNTLYYAIRHELYAVSLSGGQPTLVFSTENSDHWIFHLIQSGSYLRLHAASSPSSGGTVYRFPLAVSYELSLNQELVHMTEGDILQLIATLTPENSSAALEWITENEAIALAENGVITAVAPGLTNIGVMYNENTAAFCTVIVHSDSPFTLPADTQWIGAEAFTAASIEELILPDGLQTLDSRAFSHCPQLRLIHVPDSITSIAADAFAEGAEITFLGSPNSYCYQFAQENGYAYFIIEAD